MSVSGPLYNQIATVSTQYSDWVQCPKNSEIGLVFQHPSGVTTTYSLEVSNSSVAAKNAGTAITAPYDVTDKDNVALDAAAKSSAVNFALAISPPFEWVRVKMVTTVAGGNSIVIEYCTKLRGS